MNSPHLQLTEKTDEPDVALSSGNGGGGRSKLEARVAVLETHLQYLAKKEDIKEVEKEIKEVEKSVQNVKIWVLSGLLGGIPLAVIVTLAIINFFSGTNGNG